MLAAVRAIQSQRPQRTIVAVPVASRDACDELRTYVDEIICAFMPKNLNAIGIWYEDFSQTSDAEVRELLERAAREHAT
jgi:putative phosphoribosyl transferase